MRRPDCSGEAEIERSPAGHGVNVMDRGQVKSRQVVFEESDDDKSLSPSVYLHSLSR